MSLGIWKLYSKISVSGNFMIGSIINWFNCQKAYVILSTAEKLKRAFIDSLVSWIHFFKKKLSHWWLIG